MVKKKSLEGHLCSLPLAIKVLRKVSAKYANGIPYERAESYLENTNRILSYGQSTTEIINKLNNYGLIFISDRNRIFLKNSKHLNFM